jgi:hypothetical protein
MLQCGIAALAACSQGTEISDVTRRGRETEQLAEPDSSDGVQVRGEKAKDIIAKGLAVKEYELRR